MKLNKFVIDAYSWIEYFDGTPSGEKVKKILEGSRNLIYTNVITVAELASHFKRKDINFKEAKDIMLLISAFYEVDLKFAEEAGNLHAELKKERKNISLADIFVLLTARKINGKVITGDNDFSSLKEVIMIK